MVRVFAAVLGCAITLSGTAALAQSSGYSVVYSFNGQNSANPEASLIDVGGTLYGTTAGYGSVFSINPSTGVEQLVYSIPEELGSDPQASLLDYKGTLYGTAAESGNFKCRGGCGTVFSVDPATGTGQLVYAFPSIAHGTNPEAGLINVGSLLYGTTTSGGSNKGGCNYKSDPGCGTVFSLNPKTGAEKVVHAFLNGADGAIPTANLIDVGGLLYGTTQQGGSASGGTIFSLDPATGVEAVVYSFQGQSNGGDGADPSAGLLNVNGTLYGTTAAGGPSCDCGTVFSFDPATGVEKVVYAFKGGEADGAAPLASLVAVGNKLYGTTYSGGSNENAGTLFWVNPATGAEKIVHSFQGGSDGSYPTAGPVKVGATLFGTTTAGGDGGGECTPVKGSGCGTVFSFTP